MRAVSARENCPRRASKRRNIVSRTQSRLTVIPSRPRRASTTSVSSTPPCTTTRNALAPFHAILDWTGLTFVIEQLSGVRISLQWGLLNSYPGLVLPLVATATGTFLYRQFYLTIPDELAEAAKMDGSGPARFWWDMLVPLSRPDMIALFTSMFVWAWNQYLWPLLVTTDPNFGIAVTELRTLIP